MADAWPGTAYSYNEASILQNAPNKAGVYLIWNKEKWIYVGETNDIQRRMLEHFNGDNACITRSQPGGWGFELVQQARVSRQNALIAQLSPSCNQMMG